MRKFWNAMKFVGLGLVAVLEGLLFPWSILMGFPLTDLTSELLDVRMPEELDDE